MRISDWSSDVCSSDLGQACDDASERDVQYAEGMQHDARKQQPRYVQVAVPAGDPEYDQADAEQRLYGHAEQQGTQVAACAVDLALAPILQPQRVFQLQAPIQRVPGGF